MLLATASSCGISDPIEVRIDVFRAANGGVSFGGRSCRTMQDYRMISKVWNG